LGVHVKREEERRGGTVPFLKIRDIRHGNLVGKFEFRELVKRRGVLELRRGRASVLAGVGVGRGGRHGWLGRSN
jgi:hypothetical protein